MVLCYLLSTMVVMAEESEIETVATTSEQNQIIEIDTNNKVNDERTNESVQHSKKIQMIVGGDSEDGVAKQVTIRPDQ